VLEQSLANDAMSPAPSASLAPRVHGRQLLKIGAHSLDVGCDAADIVRVDPDQHKVGGATAYGPKLRERGIPRLDDDALNSGKSRAIDLASRNFPSRLDGLQVDRTVERCASMRKC
jgi:hypothetical protein